MLTIGHIYRFTMTLVYQNAVCRLVDFRQPTSVPVNPMTLAESASSYGNLFVSEILPVLSDELTVTNVEVEDLTDGISFASFGFNSVGGTAGDGMPSYVAIGVRLKRSTKLTRNGSKRIPGVSEIRSNGNQLVLPAPETLKIEQFYSGTTQFVDTTDPLDFYTMESVIVGRTKNVAGVYELDLTRINPVADASVAINLTTQNTRKILV